MDPNSGASSVAGIISGAAIFIVILVLLFSFSPLSSIGESSQRQAITEQ